MEAHRLLYGQSNWYGSVTRLHALFRLLFGRTYINTPPTAAVVRCLFKNWIFFCNWTLETLDISILRSKRQINIPVVVNLKFRWNKLLLLQYVNWVLCLHSAYVLIHCIESLSSAIVRYLFIYWFIHIFVYLFTSFLNTILIRCLTDGRADKLIERLRDWLTNLRANWYTDEITYWLTDHVNDWLIDQMTQWLIE